MMGASKYTSRSDLLQQKATGLVPEVTPQKQALFDRGHAAERPALAIVEEMIGEDLFPATAVHDTDDRLLASFDGVDMLESVIAEHKLWSEPLAAQVRAGDLEPHYYWQLEQQLLVSGAERAIFVCSDGTREKFVHMEYRPVPGRREALLAGWEQFARDLADYVPPAASTVEKIAAEPVEALPAVFVKVEGSIVIRENFDAFEVAMRDFLEHRLIREPKTDQHFADLELQIKAMKAAEAALDGAEAGWIAQIEPVSVAKRRKDMLRALVRENRLLAEKLLSSEKERRKGDIVAVGVKALGDHIAALNARLGKPYMPSVPADFGGCIKGLKSLSSMEDKVATELARAKIAANEIADRIQANLSALRELASEHAFLFADTAQLVLKAPDDCRAQITSRIATHQAEQERRAAELAERERARIRAEEQAKLQREQEAREAEERRQRAAAEEAERQRVAAAEAEQRRQEQEAAARAKQERQQIDADVHIADGAGVSLSDSPPMYAAASKTAGPAVIPLPTRAPAAPSVRIPLGEINKRLAVGGVEPNFSAAFLAALGFQPEAERGSKLYDEANLPLICSVLAQHFAAVAGGQREAA